MSLVARHLEENGIPTVTFSNARDISTHAFNPRLVFTNFPLGNPAGRPFDRENQRSILAAGFDLLEQATEAGTIVDTGHVWSDSREWMRLIFSDEQPFLTDEAEATRRKKVAANRAQKNATR
ncbi:MAG: hypothetical protein V3S29_07145 [bacterium]